MKISYKKNTMSECTGPKVLEFRHRVSHLKLYVFDKKGKTTIVGFFSEFSCIKTCH